MIAVMVLVLTVLLIVITCCTYCVHATWQYAEKLEERINKIERKI